MNYTMADSKIRVVLVSHGEQSKGKMCIRDRYVRDCEGQQIAAPRCIIVGDL